MICDTLEHLARYNGLHPNLDTAIDYLLTHDLSALPNGRTEVDGDEVFINVMDAALHPDAGYHPEYHKLYADLQIDITGGEGWGYTNEPGEEVGKYTVDCGFQDSASVVSGALGEGRFVLFFPTELHKPGLVQDGCANASVPTPCATSPRSSRWWTCRSSASSKKITPAPPCTSLSP